MSQENINRISIKEFLSACHDGDLDIVKKYIEQGGDISVKTSNGNDGFSRAIYRGNLEVAEYLLEQGADINTTGKTGKTPLHRAIYRGKYNSVKFLVEKGANLDLQDKDGNTALHYAAKYNYPNITEALLLANADLNIKNNSNKTALNIASSWLVSDWVEFYVYVRNIWEWTNCSSESGKSVKQMLSEKMAEADQEKATDSNEEFTKAELDENDIKDENTNKQFSKSYQENFEDRELLGEEKPDLENGAGAEA